MKALAVITGASSGIGMECAKTLSALGHPLLLLARRVEQMEKLNLPNTLCRKVDVTDYAAFEAAVHEAEAKFGKTDLLVNNAGVMLLGHPARQKLSEWEQMVDIDLKGVFYGVHIVLKDMVARNGGTIINIGSTAGRKNSLTRTVYNAVKFGVHAFTETLRMEVAESNVRVSVVAPGVVDTELLDHMEDKSISESIKKSKAAFDNGLRAKEVAEVIAYLYSLPQHICLREIVLAHTRQQA